MFLQHPQMSRLGLLAVAFSDGSVVLYALPHPGALQSCQRTQVKGRKSCGTPPLVAACWGGSARARGLPTPGTGCVGCVCRAGGRAGR